MGNKQKIANKISPKFNKNDLQDYADFDSFSFLDSFQNSQNRSFIFNRSGKIGGYCITKEKLVIEKKQINKNMSVGFGVKGGLTSITELTAESKFGASVSQVFKGTQKLSTYHLNPKANILGLQKSDEDKYVTIWYGPNKQIVQSMVIQNHQIKKGTTIHLLLKKLNQKKEEESTGLVIKSYKNISGNMLRWYSLFIQFDNSGILHQTIKIAQTPAIKMNFRKVKNYNGGCFICGYYKDQQQNSEQFKYSQTLNMIYCNECYQSTKINLEKHTLNQEKTKNKPVQEKIKLKQEKSK